MWRTVSPFAKSLLGTPAHHMEACMLFEDIPYVAADGAHARQMLDLFVPTKPFPRPMQPFVLFVHGGSWQRGGRKYRFNLYHNVGYALSGRGIVTAVMSYRLSPEVRHPEHVKDVAAAVSWCHQNAARYGGIADKLVLVGHSAGAHLVTLAMADSKYLEAVKVPPTSIAGIVGISGIYNVERLCATTAASVISDPVFGKDPAVWRAASPCNFTDAKSALRNVPLCFINAETDFHLEQDAEELCNRLSIGNPSGKSLAERHIVKGTNHSSIVSHIGGEDDVTTNVIVDFVHRCVPATR